MENIRDPTKLSELEVLHEFDVVENFVAPVILGVDFLHGNELMLDLTRGHVVVHRANPTLPVAQMLPLYQAERKSQARAYAITALEQPGTDVVDECVVPNDEDSPSLELPECPVPAFHSE